MSIKYVDLDGLSHFKSKLDTVYVEKETGKGLSTNDYTDAEKTKLSGVEAGAQVNVIESITVNGKTATITGKSASVTIETGTIDSISVNGVTQQIDSNKNVDITVPTKTSDLTNDSNFAVDASYVHTDNNYTTAEKSKLNGIEAGAEANVQADWNETDNTSDSFIANKPSLATVATTGDYEDLTNKPTIPTNVSDLTNDTGFITASVNNLTNYYLKSEIYTQTEVDNLIGAIQTLHFEIVSTLPASGASNILYLVPKSKSQTNNIYDEYVYAKNAWEKIGDTEIDLSGYVRTADLVAITNAEIDSLFV